MGSPEDVVAPLAYLFQHGNSQGFQVVGVVSQPARSVGRHSTLQDPPVALWAKQNQIPTLQPESAKTSDFLNALREWQPDVIVTAAYGQILSDEFLKIPRRATINIHPSLLPHYRGAIPVPAAIMDGLTSTAVTILFTVKKLDAGNIILARSYDIGTNETAGELTPRLFAESGPMLVEALEKLKDPRFLGIPQDDSQATFCKKIEKDSGAIDWSLDAKTIVNRFRAFEPWPGSWTYLGDRRIAVTAMTTSEAELNLTAGTFIFDKPTKSLFVGTVNGILQIAGVKPAGSKAMDAAGFWNGLKDKSLTTFCSTATAHS
jgi:methionyl-tRNA formyltransferase